MPPSDDPPPDRDHSTQSVSDALLGAEVDARWRLVETAWSAGVNPGLTLPVEYDRPTDTLFVSTKLRRRSVTGVVGALSGYQDGRCAYCHELMHERGVGKPIVEHVLPFTLMERTSRLQDAWPGPPLDAVWNLLLACQPCNSAKAARVPAASWMPWLIDRNEHLIASQHPLRQTLIEQTGPDISSRRTTIRSAHAHASNRRQTEWLPPFTPA